MSSSPHDALSLPLASLGPMGIALLAPILACAVFFIWHVMKDAGRGRLASIVVALCIMLPTTFFFLNHRPNHRVTHEPRAPALYAKCQGSARADVPVSKRQHITDGRSASQDHQPTVRAADHAASNRVHSKPIAPTASFGHWGPYGRVVLGLVGLTALLHLIYVVIDSITRRRLARTRIAVDCLLVILVFAAIVKLT